MMDSLARGAEFAEIVRGFVERETAPLRAEIAGLRAQLEGLPVPKDGADGEKGAPGEKGDPGKDGADAPPVTDEQIEAAVAKWLEANPPRDGKDGQDGAPGEKGDPGEPGEKGEKGDPGEKGERGADGEHGAPGRDGVDGEKGDPGQDGRDGVAAPVVAGAFKDDGGELILTLTDGTVLKTGLRDGKDGERGADGFSLTDFDVSQPDARTVVLSFGRGDTTEKYELALGGVIYRGVYKDGDTYELGDLATWAGSLWHCNEPTTEKPGEGAKAWTLAAKKGRDGRDGKNGEKGEPGKQGPPGRDGKGSW